MAHQQLKRIFTYNGVELADPDPSMQPKDVMSHYSGLYPELVNGTVVENEIDFENATQEFEIKSVAGTKG